MSESSSVGRQGRPVRIELATSEIEGGRCKGWADPSQVLAVVAISEPSDSFARYLEAAFSEGPDSGDGEADQPNAGNLVRGSELPSALRQLIRRLKAIHQRLYRENKSLMRDPRWISLTCAYADEDRVYFVKGAPSRVYLLRGGKAFRAEEETKASGEAFAAIGKQESLKLEVTSLPVVAGDTVVLLISENDTPPDLRALTNVFGQTQDLKRACDGLVNLLGLQAEGAGAVALRFLAIGANNVGWENPLDGLASELERFVGVKDPSHATGESAPISPRSDGRLQLPDNLGGELANESRTAGPEREVVELSDSGVEPAVASDQRAAETGKQIKAACEASASESTGASLEARCSDHEPAPSEQIEGETLQVVGISTSQESTVDSRPRMSRQRRETGIFWSVLVFLLVAGLALLAAIPIREGMPPMGVRFVNWLQEQDVRSWIPGRGDSRGTSGGDAVRGSGFGSLQVAPDPPARSVLLNGEVKASGTPVRLNGIPAGRHKIGLDLGPCGIWETELHIRKGETATLAPMLMGSIEVLAADPGPGGVVWAPGRSKVPVPVRIDSLPVGWNRIFYEDERLPMWDRNVLVRAGETARVIVPNDFSSDQGLVRIAALSFRPGEGLVDSAGDSIWVDGEFAGVTPAEMSLSPGLHSIRVGSSDQVQYSEVLEVRAGSTRHVQGRLEGKPQPRILHNAPGKIWIRGPVLLSVEIRGPAGSVRPTLHLPELPPGSRQIPMTPVDQTRGVYVGIVSPEVLPESRAVPYYFTIQGSGGETIWSDLYRLECVDEGA